MLFKKSKQCPYEELILELRTQMDSLQKKNGNLQQLYLDIKSQLDNQRSTSAPQDSAMGFTAEIYRDQLKSANRIAAVAAEQTNEVDEDDLSAYEQAFGITY